jgi:galactose mutarotase-like enzyme
MYYIIENDYLRVTIASLGAEVISVVDKETEKELWWNADPAYWAGHSPILFPACGGLWNGEYKYKGNAYKLVKHGFVRTMEFKPTDQEQYAAMSFVVQETEETKKQYPFDFSLTISYALNGKTLTCNASVANPSESEVLYYQIGGHPAIMLPDFKEDADVVGYMRPGASSVYTPHGAQESITVVRASEQGCFGGERYYVPQTEEGLIPISVDTFSNEALIFDKNQVKEITLLRTDKTTEICRIKHGAPVLLIWQMTGLLCPYVCVEPWYGMPDRIGYSVDLDIRPYTQHAMPGQVSMHNLWDIEFC